MIRASVTSSVNSQAVAQIHIPATAKSTQFLPRSAVHIFYMDAEDPYEQSESIKRRLRPKYKLLFEGEYMGLGFSKSPSSRSTVLRCVDISNNFSYAHKFVMTASNPIITTPIQRLYTGAKEKADVGVVAPISSIIAKVVTGEISVVEGVKTLIREVFVGGDKGVSTNAFLQSVQQRFDIVNKVFSLDDKEIVNLVKTKQLISLMNRGIGAKSSTYSLHDMISLFLGYIQYQRATILAPKLNGNAWNSIVFNPNMYATVPPKCNVLFPDDITSINYSDNFMQAPTRIFVQAPPFGFEANDPLIQIASTYIAPNQLSKLLPTGGAKLNKPKDNFHQELTDEERIKGIIPAVKSVGQPEYASQVGADKDSKGGSGVGTEGRNYLINLAEYELDMRRAAARDVGTMTGGFNPEAVPGAPALVLDSEVAVHGILESISHSFSAAGNEGAVTSYQIRLPRLLSLKALIFDDLLVSDAARAEVDRITDLVRADLSLVESARPDRLELNLTPGLMSDLQIPLEFIEIVESINGDTVKERESREQELLRLVDEGKIEKLPKRPRWLNAQFNDNTIDSAYQQLYGCDSVLAPIDDSERFTSIVDAAAALSAEHIRNPDPFQFNTRYTARTGIVTQSDFERIYGLAEIDSVSGAYGVIGFSEPDEDGLSTVTQSQTGIFRENRQKRVRDYVNELNSKTAFLG